MTKVRSHIIGLITYTLIFAIVDLIINNKVQLKFFSLTLLLQIISFYTFFGFLYYIFLSQKRSILKAISIFFAGIVISLVVFKWYFYLKTNSGVLDYANLPIILSLYIRISFYSLGYFFFERSLKNQKQAAQHEKNIILTEKKNLENENKISTLQEEKANLDKKLFQSETNFLRAQINPHFLQNCLNFLYSDTRKTNPDAAEAILLLSDLMRYSVADNTATGGMTMLDEELRQLDSVIQINQLRFKETLNIVFIKEGNIENKRIVPIILLTLVENLIKYGDLKDVQNPARIQCTVIETENKVHFTTFNKKAFASGIHPSGGLGFKNINERLSLIWSNNFLLEHKDENGFFTVTVTMPYISI